MSMTFRLFALVAMLIVSPAIAQGDNPLAPVDTSSPSATFQSFLTQSQKIKTDFADYIADKTSAKVDALVLNVARMRRLLDLEGLPPATRDKVGGSAFAYLTDILARLPAVPAAAIPGAAGKDWGTLPDKWAIPGTDIQIALVKDGPRAGEYLFSGDSVERLPEYHALIINQPPVQPVIHRNWYEEQIRLTGPLFSDSLIRSLPDILQRPVLDTPLWKVVLTAILVLAIFLAVFFWAMLVHRITAGASRARGLFWHLTIPLLLVGATYLADWFFAAQVNLSGDFAVGESFVAAVALYLAAAWAAWVGCFLVVEAIIATPSIPDNSYDAHLLRLAARVGAILAAGAVIVYGATDIGIPALGLLAGLGVGGFALALASQSTVENLFGGISIFADRPFRVGDFIRFGEGAGRVEAIGPRSSRVRALDGTLATVPNGDLAKMHITNYSLRDKCLFQHILGLRYETSPAQFEWLLEALRRLLTAHPMVEQTATLPRVVLIGFGDSSINVELQAYVLTADFSEFLRIQEHLILDIMKTVETAGSGFAFPSQTTYFVRDDGIDAATKTRIEEEMVQRSAEAMASAAAEPPSEPVVPPAPAPAPGWDKAERR